MPTLQKLIKQTMMFAADKSPDIEQVNLDREVVTDPVPDPIPTDPADVEKVFVWSWRHDPAEMNKLTKIGCRVRSMGMNYKMVMPVLDDLTVENIEIVTVDDRTFKLPVTKDFVQQKRFSKFGYIPPSTSGLFQLETRTDASFLLVYAYKMEGAAVKPMTPFEVGALDDRFMPEPGEVNLECATNEKLKIFCAPLRVVVCIGFTFCRERNDFAPGGPLGVCRAYPHVMIMASENLKLVRGDVVGQRSANTPHAGSLVDTTYFDNGPISVIGGLAMPVDTMGPAHAHELFADTNDPVTLAPGWDNIFAYYDADPLSSGTGFGKPLVMVDPSKGGVRPGKNMLKRLIPNSELIGSNNKYADGDVLKLARQGEFDNVHIAPRMGMGPVNAANPTLRSEQIGMAPFCIHDCLHMHTRWGNFLDEKPLRGFGLSGEPYQTAGAPMVPHNQTVLLTLLKPAGFRYTFIATEMPRKGDPAKKDPIRAGEWTVGFHHGFGYAGDFWGLEGRLKIQLAREQVDMRRKTNKEHDFGARQATNSWAAFYWHLRYGGSQDKIAERLVFPDLKALRSL